MQALARSNGRIACQTPLLQEFLEGMLGTAPERYVPLPPMVPQRLCDEPRTVRRGRQLCYIGKFDPHYMVEEMIDAFGLLRERFSDAAFVVAGDKFHDPECTGEFRMRLTGVLEGTPGVVWRGGLPRDEIADLLSACDIGSCWRSGQYDQSLEMSTKVLEYAAAGLPFLLNPSRINRLVFGDDYPLFVDTPESFVDRTQAAFEDDGVYARAAAVAHETCERFTFAKVNEQLQPYLAAYRTATSVGGNGDRPRRLLFVGHDLKFCRAIIEHFQNRPDCIVRLDTWQNHTRHDERRSEELLRWADTVWCEWCLGNAVWYSARVRPTQHLIVRLHRQEVTTPFPEAVTWSSVNKVVFIAPHVQATMLKRLGPAVAAKARLIHNTIDCERFEREKTPGFEFRLGLLGYCPKLKNPRLAIEILRRLIRRDERWKLVLTGRPPQSYAWLWARKEERSYYEKLEKHIASRGLEQHLIRQDWTSDPPAWYADIGFILSTSDLEGSHQAVAEAMAAGCVPVVRRWEGAAEVYPQAQLFDSAEEAAGLIQRVSANGLRAELGAQGQREAQERFDTRVILPQLEPLLLAKAPAPNAEATLPSQQD